MTEIAGSGAVAPVVVGVDGGGTGSRAAVVELSSGRELSREFGSAAIVVPGAETASLEAIRDVTRRALLVAGFEPGTRAEILVAGLAGVGREADRIRMRELLAASGLAARVDVRNDAWVAMYDAFGTGPGILLVGGTGSIAMARLPSGVRRRVGGYGATVGDEGSGWSLGLQAIQATLHTLDGRIPGTALARIVTGTFGTDDPAELVDRLRTATKGEVAALAPRVVEAADAGDAEASAIAERAAAALAAHVAPLARAWSEDPATAGMPPHLALLGGLVKPGGPLRSRLLPLLEAMGVTVGPESPDPVRGAAAFGSELSGTDPLDDP